MQSKPDSPNADPTTPSPNLSQPASEQQVPDWWKVYDGLEDEEIERFDQAIRQRANLTRTFE